MAPLLDDTDIKAALDLSGWSVLGDSYRGAWAKGCMPVTVYDLCQMWVFYQ